MPDNATGDDHFEIRVVAQQGRDIEVIGNQAQVAMLAEGLGHFFGCRADIDEQRHIVGNFPRDHLRDADFFFMQQNLARRILDILDARGEPRAAVITPQQAAVAEFVDVPAYRLRSDLEALGQFVG